MPVIRERPLAPDASKHRRFVKLLAAELSAPHPHGQPLVQVRTFQTGLMAVSVVWDVWAAIDELDRAAVILTAYEAAFGSPERDKVAMPIGYTEPEAAESGLLPFEVLALLRKTDPPEWHTGCRQAMLDLGASDLWKKGHPRLRLPTEELAAEYVRELTARVPGSDDVWAVTRVSAE